MRWLLLVWLLIVLRLLISCCIRAAPTTCPSRPWTRWRRYLGRRGHQAQGPGRLLQGRLEYLGKLVDAGLAGVEVYHRENSEEDRARLLKFIEECRAAGTDLLVTGSSDYHGAGKPNLLGENTTDAATVARIREQLVAQ